MAALTVEQISLNGLVPTLVAPTETTGDTFANDGACLVVVANGSAAPITVTIQSTAADGTGLEDDVVVTVAAGATTYIGKFGTTRFNGAVTVICSAVADVTIGAIKL